MEKKMNTAGKAVVIVMLVLLAAAAAVAGTATSKERGSLTAVEQDGRVIIEVKQVREGATVTSERIYKLSPYALVYNDEGKRVKPGDLKLPADVIIEYSNTSQGAVINMLKVTPQ